MDSLTQAVLGAALQGTVLGRIQGRRSLLYGAALATLPDLDVVIRYADPVSQMTYHRGFSHSIFVLTGLALLLAWWVNRCWPGKGYTLPRLFLAFWLVLVTHPVLDAFTVYGTQLFWPLALTPQSWAAVFIIDPVYTVPLLAAVIYTLAKGVTGQAVRLMALALVAPLALAAKADS
ncbi:MAG: metal-dependent hydrolase, partial [Pseudomonas sp.]